METEHSKTVSSKKSNFIIALSVPLLLLSGVILSLTQTQQQQEKRTSAEYRIVNCTVSSANMAIKAAEQTLFNKINAYRGQETGQPLLVMDTALKRASQWHANDMNTKNYAQDIDFLGRRPDQRAADCGLTGQTTVGQSIRQGNTNPDVIFTTLQAEQKDRENMLNPAYRRIGIALSGTTWSITYADGGSGQPIISQPNTASPTLAFPTIPFDTPEPTSPQIATTIPTVPFDTPPAQETAAPQPTDMPDPTDMPEPTDIPAPTGTPDPTDIPAPTPTPLPPQAINMRVTVSVKLPAIGKGGNLFPKHLSRRVIITLFDVDNKEVKKGTGFLTYDRNDLFTGTINLGSMSQGTYYVKVAIQEQVLPNVIKSITLQSTVQPLFQTFLANTVNTLPAVTLIQGDLDADNALTINDYKLALVCFQTKGCVRDPALDDTFNMIDFNDDGNVDVKDYNVLLRSFFETKGD